MYKCSVLKGQQSMLWFCINRLNMQERWWRFKGETLSCHQRVSCSNLNYNYLFSIKPLKYETVCYKIVVFMRAVSPWEPVNMCSRPRWTAADESSDSISPLRGWNGGCRRPRIASLSKGTLNINAGSNRWPNHAKPTEKRCTGGSGALKLLGKWNLSNKPDLQIAQREGEQSCR